MVAPLPQLLRSPDGDTAAHLVDSVLPRVPIRQWVCSFPRQLRYAMGYDRRLCAVLMGAFASELSRSYRRRAKRALGLSSVSDAPTASLGATPGSVPAHPRTGSGVRVHGVGRRASRPITP